ncbi:MAG: FkbM family methyltransferase [Cyanobacteria bacterium J06598_1]
MALQTVQFILDHPLSRRNKPKAFRRFLSWQIRSRLTNQPVVYSFVDQSRLLVRRGMTGATGNVYAGLHEFEDMAFVLHALRPDDWFVDVGANIGSYTVLAAAAVGSNCVALEPVPAAYAHLLDNMSLNGVSDRVEPLNIGLGDKNTTLHFSADQDTMNHVVAPSETSENSVEVQVKRLDEVLQGRTPTVIKIDVEGWETNVVAGAESVLSQVEPLAVLMEFGLGERYGFDDQDLYEKMLNLGFEAVSYSPFDRQILRFSAGEVARSQPETCVRGNILFVNQIDYFRERVAAAPTYRALDIDI